MVTQYYRIIDWPYLRIRYIILKVLLDREGQCLCSLVLFQIDDILFREQLCWVGKRIKVYIMFWKRASEREWVYCERDWWQQSQQAIREDSSCTIFACLLLQRCLGMQCLSMLCPTHALSMPGEGVISVNVNSDYFGRFRV